MSVKQKITFVCIGAEYLGVEYLSAMLKKEGHEVSLVFDPALFDDKYWLYLPIVHKLFDRKKRLINKIIKSKPDFVAFSVLTDTYQRCCELAGELKKRINAKIVFGGIHPTSIPEEVIKKEFVDYVVIGESEYAILDLVNGKINAPNIWHKNGNKITRNKVRPLIPDLDSLPFPDKKLFSKYIPQKSYTIITSRDCPFNCTYCCNSVLHSLYGFANRKRSVQNVMEELLLAKTSFNYKHVSFVDDNFTIDKKWLKEFLPIFKREIGVPFRCLTHPTIINYDTAKILKENGCEAIDIGIQSLNPRIRREILNRYESNEQIIAALDALKKANLKMHLDHIVGIPTETEEDLIKAAKFYIKYKPDRFTYYYLQYFPNTEIINKAGLSKEKIKRINEGQEKMYLVGGSVQNATTKNFEIVFKLIPLLPPRVLNLILDKKIYKAFRFLPVVILIDILSIVKTREFRAIEYLIYYARNIVKRN